MTELVAPWEIKNDPVAPPPAETTGELIEPWKVRQAEASQDVYDEYNVVERQIAKLGLDPEAAGSLIRRIGAETVPAVIGATAGAQIGAPLGPVGRSTGVVLGGALGALTGKRLDEIFGNVRPDEQTLISDIITAAGGAIAMPGKAMSPNQAREIAKILERRGIRTPTPGVVSDRALVQAIEQKLREIPFSGGTIESAVQKIYDDFGRAIEHLSDDATLVFAAPSEAGEAIAKGTTRTVTRGPGSKKVVVGTGAQSKLDAFRARGDELYGIVKTLMGDVNPSVTPNQTMKFIDEFSGGFENPKLVEIMGDDFLKALGEGLGGPQTWSDMNKLLQRIGAKTKFGSGEDIGTMKQLWKAIHDDMDETAKALGGNEQKAWAKARNYWSRAIIGKEEELGKIAKHANPQRLFDALMGKGNLTAVTTAKKAVDANTWKSVQELVIRRMGEVPGTEGQFNLSQFLTSWKRISHDSNATKALFGNKLGDMKELVSIARRLNAPSQFANTSKTGAGNLMMNFITGGAGIGGYTAGGVPGAVAAMTGTVALPAVMARIWTSPVMMKWFLRGKDIPTSSYKSTSAWAKAFLKMAAAEGINEYESLQIHDLIMDPFTNAQADVPSVPNQ